MKFRPLHDRVVVQRLESEEKTAGGIIIPDTAKEKPMEGKVIAVGAGARDRRRAPRGDGDNFIASVREAREARGRRARRGRGGEGDGGHHDSRRDVDG